MNTTPLDFFELNKQTSKHEWKMLTSFTFPSDPELLMLMNELDKAGIPNHLLDKSNGAIAPIMTGEKGGLQVYINENHWQEAVAILKSQRSVATEIYDKTDDTPKRSVASIIMLIAILLLLIGIALQAFIYQ
jgi:hypothetical protein